MKSRIFIALLILFILSCSSNIDKETKEEQQAKKEQQIDAEQKSRLESMNNLATQYGAVIGFDTLRFSLTLQYQNFLNKNNKIILDYFKVIDVTRDDSAYIVSIEKGHSYKLFIDLICNEDQVQELLADTSDIIARHIRVYDKFIIATISSIQKVKYCIYSDSENNGDDDQTVNLELGASDAFLCKGKLINVIKN